MTLHDVNIQVFKLIVDANQSVQTELRQALKAMPHPEAFTFLRMAHECRSKDPVALLQRLRAHQGWEKHCDLSWQQGAIEFYTRSFQNAKAA